jgi:hypothetical protein
MSVRTSFAILTARPVRLAALGLLLAVVAVVLADAHFQLVANWAIGTPVSTALSRWEWRWECMQWTHYCMHNMHYVSTDDLLLPLLAVSGVALMAGIAVKRRYRRFRHGETDLP